MGVCIPCAMGAMLFNDGYFSNITLQTDQYYWKVAKKNILFLKKNLQANHWRL
jgi:hypothetical protein